MHRFRFSKLYNYLFLGLILILSFTMVGLSSWNVFDMFNLDYVSLEPVCYISNSTGKTDYYTIEGALKKAKSGDTVYIYIGKNPTIRKSVEIKNGVTLCMPFEQDVANNINKYDGRQAGSNTANWFDDCGENFADCDSGSVAKYRKNSLKVAKNVTLTNNGNLYIGGILGYEGAGLSGATSGNYCEIVMDNNSTIINRGTIECYGYIKEVAKKNDSKLIVESGAVYSPFVVHDYAGGNNTVGCYKTGKISPFSIFYMPNIQVFSRYSYNSSLKGMADLYTGAVDFKLFTLPAQHNNTNIDIIGNKSSLIILNNTNSYVDIRYNSDSALYTTKEDESKTEMKFYKGASNGPMKMSVSVAGINEEVNTKSVLFPISYKYDLSFYEGTYNFTTPIKVMNGSRIFVDSTASLNVNSDFIVYSKEFNDNKSQFKYPTKYPRADLIVNGNITYNKANGGLTQTTNTKSDYSYIYENSSTLNVKSKEGTGKLGEFTESVVPTFEETAQAKLETASNHSIENIEKTIYISEKNTDYFVKASNLGSYKINYHLDGGTIDGETATNDVVTKEYPIMKGKTKTLTDYAISSPKKRFYSFSDWRRDSSTGASASGQDVWDGIILDVYASYELKTYSITYNVQYAEGLEMSDKYQNTNKTSFALTNLPLDIPKPTDGNLKFYGWYFNGDTSKEILQITKDMEGVGYDDISVSGYFSDKRMCAIKFDANGHADYFSDISSFNTVADDPTKVRLPASLYDDNPKIQYYLIGFEDEKGKLFNKDTYGAFTQDKLVLKAKWGNKTEIKYFDRNNNYLDYHEYYKSGAKIYFQTNTSYFNKDIMTDYCVVPSDSTTNPEFKKYYAFSGWKVNNVLVSSNEIYVVGDTNVNAFADYGTEFRTYYRISITVYRDMVGGQDGKKMTISSSEFNNEYIIEYGRGEVKTYAYAFEGDSLTITFRGTKLAPVKWTISGSHVDNDKADTEQVRNITMPGGCLEIAYNV